MYFSYFAVEYTFLGLSTKITITKAPISKHVPHAICAVD